MKGSQKAAFFIGRMSMRNLSILSVVLLICCTTQGQSKLDTIPQLGMIRVQGFGTSATRLQTPASVSLLKESDLNRYQGQSLLPAVNNIPGVRMEERSPGSYRLSIRGSLLRSPFGVRNVKLYLNEFIFTDAGGNSYLNLLDLSTLSGLEVLRGPAGSTYGTGTGGVVLLSSRPIVSEPSETRNRPTVRLGLSVGSYGMFSQHIRYQTTTPKGSVQFSQGHYQAEGFRENSRMRRDVVQWNSAHRTGSKGLVGTMLLFSDLGYRTPGGLTYQQMMANPKQARPATATLPGAVSQRAGIRNRTSILGLSYTHQFDDQWSWMSALTQAFTDFENPFISNYEKRSETNIGLRSVLTRKGTILNKPMVWQSGMEWQRGFYRIDSTGNAGGKPDANLVRDKVGAGQGFIFSQAEYRFTSKWIIQAGLSINHFNYRISRTIGKPDYQADHIQFNPQFVPRLAFSRQLAQKAAWHTSVTRGFSPPSLAEIRPSAGGIATGLQAEQGWSWETGIKGSWLKNRIQYDFSAFRFDLTDAIVRRTNASGAEYFINAGDIRQQGLEAFLEAYPVHRNLTRGLFQVRSWVSATMSDFRFGSYQSATTSLKNKRLTGVPRRNISAGIDVITPRGWYLSVTHQMTDSLPLTDPNDAFASAYRLLHAKVGWKGRLKRMEINCFLAGDNLLDDKYSLGNDLNAFGRRYYNPAPPRNWVTGLILRRQ